MNSDKKFVFVFYAILGGLVLVLSIFLIVSINSNKANGTPIDVAEMKTLNPDEKGLTSKNQAYSKKDHESILNIEEENVNIDFKRLFKQDTADLSIDDISMEGQNTPKADPYDNRINQTSIQKKKRTTTLTRQYSHTDCPSDSYQNQPKIELRRESFNSFSQTSRIQADAKALVVRAVVHTKQTVYDGATVKLRAVSSFPLNGIVIPENTLIYGVASVVQERVAIIVKTVSFNNSIIPVSLHAYDRDGIEGIYIPGLVQHELKNESVDEVLSETQSSLNISRLATIPLTVARNRNRVTEAILTDNYEIILK
ncbi:MAG: conjugative transposon protein TraM [Bacteroidales bacterium]|nr:conjugative transposon protein TraM [Bacteroidales bacterium]